ncbi:farnesyl diphosphate synthase [Desulfacinum hydrothermale]|uniref:farnesyl diphosphate synthase n=1 Tax=Desulfacinum hydrothermale TaxID=109258 RepID=UPI0009FCF7E8
MDLKAFLEAQRQRVDAALERFLPASDSLEKTVVEAARYSLFAGGKRLRPILCLTAAEVVGGTADEALTAACALEMVHTYSLIHDDLPAMDDDDLRRGRPTNHKVYGEAVAILAGDLLLTEAFGLLADPRIGSNAAVAAERRLRALTILARASGMQGMIAGQVIDLESETREVDLATVEYMHIHKTGALISASLEMGAVLGGGNDQQIQALVQYGRHLGLAFQITDDLLDIEGDPDVMGKPSGSDVAKNKKTYPALLGLARSREMARKHVDRAVDALKTFDEKAEPLRAIARYLLERKA